MRWDRLFADLEAEFEAAEASEVAAEIAERIRYERGRLRLVDRLRGSLERPVVVRVLGVGRLEGVLSAVGPDWLLLRPPGTADRAVRLAAVLEISGLTASSAEPGSEGQVAARFGLAALLRRLALDRAVVTVDLIDGGSLTGTIGLVGADLLELTGRRADEPALALISAHRWTVPLTAVAVVREH